MTRKVDGLLLIEPEPNQQCDDCGKSAQLRPYGPKGSCICVKCGQKDPKGTHERMMAILAPVDDPFPKVIALDEGGNMVGAIIPRDRNG